MLNIVNKIKNIRQEIVIKKVIDKIKMRKTKENTGVISNT